MIPKCNFTKFKSLIGLKNPLKWRFKIKTRAIKLIACPKCLGDLKLYTKIRDDLILDSRRLSCTKCNLSYEIKEGVPQLFNQEDISEKDQFFIEQADNYASYYEKFLKFTSLLMFSWEPCERMGTA